MKWKPGEVKVVPRGVEAGPRRFKLDLPRGNLKGKWNHIAMDYPDLEKAFESIRPVEMMVMVGITLIPFLAVFLIFIDLILFIVVFLFIGIIVWIIVLAVGISVYNERKRMKDPNNPILLTVNLKVPKGSDPAGPVRSFFSKSGAYAIEEVFDRSRVIDGKDIAYLAKTENGIEVKVLLVGDTKDPMKFLHISYPKDRWMDALELQMDMDGYLHGKGVV